MLTRHGPPGVYLVDGVPQQAGEQGELQEEGAAARGAGRGAAVRGKAVPQVHSGGGYVRLDMTYDMIRL